jgi:hypothetical protein
MSRAGASTVLVNRAPDLVTIVTVPPQPQLQRIERGEGSTSTRCMSRATIGL